MWVFKINMQVPIDGKETPTNRYQMMSFPNNTCIVTIFNCKTLTNDKLLVWSYMFLTSETKEAYIWMGAINASSSTSHSIKQNWSSLTIKNKNCVLQHAKHVIEHTKTNIRASSFQKTKNAIKVEKFQVHFQCKMCTFLELSLNCGSLLKS